MTRIRTFALALAVAFGLAAVPQAAEAQFSWGVHVANATELEVGGESGNFGLGAKLGINPPLLPLSFYASGDYFFVDCGDADCGYQNFGVDANWNFLPLPMFDVYATGGVVFRRLSLDGDFGGIPLDESEIYTGFQIGAGASFNFVASAYLEGRYEIFSDEDGGNQVVIRLGIGL